MPEPLPTQAHALTATNIEKVFPSGVRALAPVSFSLTQGEFVSLVGPSGCGKSTLLRIIADLTKPSSGEITLAPKAKSDSVGFVFQEPTLMPWATVVENVALPLKLARTTDASDKDRIATVLEWVGLQDFHGAYPRELSGGMKMRVSIARALVLQPELLLLDEPFAALDEFTRAKLNEDLLRLWEEHGWTAVFVTHSIREAAYLSSRVLVMSPRPGRLVSDIPVPFDHPRQPALRDDHTYSDFCADVSMQLANAMAEAGA